MTYISSVTDAEIQSLTESILTRYGIDFTCYEPKSLKRRILRLLNNLELASVHELWLSFLRDPQFVYTFMNEISVGMTSMFRDPDMWKLLKTRINSDFGGAPLIDIWHAGCSTGEEVYSMGILLEEINMRHKAKAVATDFNQDALLTSKEGVYHKIKMIENENNFRKYSLLGDLSKYYQRDENQCVMDANLINHVKFSYQNLITEKPPSPFAFDMILCRNVMIYFDTKAKIKLLNEFYQALKPGGLFIIGFFDTMSHLIDGDKFELMDDRAKIFRRL